MKQDRRTLNLPREVYEELSCLQAATRLILKGQKADYILSKTAMTNVLKALILNTTAEELSKILNQ